MVARVAGPDAARAAAPWGPSLGLGGVYQFVLTYFAGGLAGLSPIVGKIRVLRCGRPGFGVYTARKRPVRPLSEPADRS